MNFDIYRKPIEDVLIRAFKTFLQTAIAVLVASGTGYLEVGVIQSAALAGGAAALSAIQNSLGKREDEL